MAGIIIRRHGIRSLLKFGEQLSSDHAAAEELVRTLSHLEENDIDERDVYNMVEGGLFFKQLPTG